MPKGVVFVGDVVVLIVKRVIWRDLELGHPFIFSEGSLRAIGSPASSLEFIWSQQMVAVQASRKV